MSVPTQLQLEDVRRAWEARDPEGVRLTDLLARQADPKDQKNVLEGVANFNKFVAAIHGKAFRKKPEAEQAHYRVSQLKALEAPDAPFPLPDRLKVHEVILPLWQDNGPFARRCLLEIIQTVQLTYGPWRALKRIFKESEQRGDMEIFGALAARFDAATAGRDYEKISRETMAYVCRRGWRYLRRLGKSLPAAYADAAAEVLAWYPDSTRWDGTWIANHVFYHETGKYNRKGFSLHPAPTSLLKDRAFADLWQRTPRPLFSLLERARSEKVREFAASALKADFRSTLREVEPAWVARLVGVGSRTVDEFVVWVLNNVPRFEQAAFRKLGLHEAVLRLFDSASPEAAAYAAEYARTHARDLPLEELLRLANNDHAPVRKLAADLLQSRDPRKDVGLEAWGRLLETEHGHDLAAAAIRKNFGARELTPEWFKGRLLSESDKAFDFAKSLLPQVHPPQKLGPAFFVDLIEGSDDREAGAARRAVKYATAELARFDPNALDSPFLRRALLHPLTTHAVRAWIDQGRLKAQALPADFYKALAFHPMWEADPWLAALRQGGRPWAKGLKFDEELADKVLSWMGDVRRFSPADLGFDWLLQLVARGEPRYHDFAVDYMTKAFVPADFAPQAAAPMAAAPTPPTAPAASTAAGAAPQADLKGASFVFTGKLATMTRAEAQKKVTQANGSNASSVSGKLHYLVIGDEGSPLYGAGKKGDKQLSAEKVNAAGGNIKIISETAFLKMLTGERQEESADAALAGSERLWRMLVSPGAADAPLSQFAARYIRRHHPDIGPALTERPVDPGAEIPAAFLTFERVEPLFFETRKPLRELALELARWEFARWSPPVGQVLRLSEAPFADVRRFVAEALLADDTPETRRYRLNPDVLTPAAVYRFVESVDEPTRDLGMRLIQRWPRLRLPEELFRLTESPDRKVRAFVIRELSSLYRDRGITADWKPPPLPQPTVGAAAKKAAAAATVRRGEGAPHRPDRPPAGDEALRAFLRRILFEVPPGRLEGKASGRAEEEGEAGPGAAGASGASGAAGVTTRLKPLPARKAKLALIEVMRDLALGNRALAGVVLPLLEEFLASRGKSEQEATLVAVTRIRHATGAGKPVPRLVPSPGSAPVPAPGPTPVPSPGTPGEG